MCFGYQAVEIICISNSSSYHFFPLVSHLQLRPCVFTLSESVAINENQSYFTFLGKRYHISCKCEFTQDIADAAYRKRRGRPQLPGLGKVIADILFSLLLQVLFLIQVSINT